MAGSLGNDLAVLITELHANISHAESVSHGLSHGQFNWRPASGAWSIGQNLAHLNTVKEQEVTPLRQAIESGQARHITGEGPFAYGFLACKLVASLEPVGTSKATRRKFTAPKQYEPPDESRMDETLGRYIKITGEIRELMYLAAGLHLARAKTQLPALPVWLRPLYKMPLGARFAMLAAHDRRHLSQAEQIRYNSDFPQK